MKADTPLDIIASEIYGRVGKGVLRHGYVIPCPLTSETSKVEMRYHEAKDTLYLRILPKRPARMAETDYGFYIHYHWDDQTKMVGFEWLELSTYFNAIDELGVIPDLDVTFDGTGTSVRGLDLKKALHWAYQRYVLKQESPTSIRSTQPTVVVA